MNNIDVIILVILLIPVLLGLKKGFLKSIFSLAGILTGLFIATRYYDKLSALISFIQVDRKLIDVISFVCIIIVSYMIFIYFSKAVSGLNSVTKVIDRIFGAFLGLFKGLIIASLFLLISTKVFVLFPEKETEKSRFYFAVINIAPDVYNYIKVFFPEAKTFYEEIKKL